MLNKNHMPPSTGNGHGLLPNLLTTIRTAWQWWLTEMGWLIKPITHQFTNSQIPLLLVTDATEEPCLSAQSSEQVSDWPNAAVGRSIIILLHPEQVLQLSLTLPRSARANLRPAVRYQLAVEAPIDEAALYFDIGDIAVARARDEIVIEIALCKRSLVANLEKIVRSVGATGFLVGFSPSGELPPMYKFYTSYNMRQSPAAARLNRWLTVSAIGIMLAIGPVLYMSASWLEAGVRVKINEGRAAQGNAINLAEEHARIRAIRELLAQSQKLPGVLRVMEDIAIYLPNQAWISQFQYEHGHLKLLGYAVDPTATARALEQSEHLRSIKLESVSQLEPGSGDKSVPQFVLNAAFANKEAK
ncbi:PilN domain-containing protein [Nitrosomonas eutropha]|uniref:PilN domain-containing protein n=3 Tax=Nitrosomonas TaxID=914 RepID=UPI0009430A51|nr:PilN domain-containing protein [Nitrosomonas eutropha]